MKNFEVADMFKGHKILIRIGKHLSHISSILCNI